MISKLFLIIPFNKRLILYFFILCAKKGKTYQRRYCGELGIINKSNNKIRKSVLSTILDEIGLDEAMKQGGHTQKSTLLNNYHFSRRTDLEKERAMEVALDL